MPIVIGKRSRSAPALNLAMPAVSADPNGGHSPALYSC